MLNKYITLSNLTLLVALSLSTVAEYYAIIGLTAIFAGAFVPIIIMGVVLGIAKIVTTVWLRKYWHKVGILLKIYLISAVVVLAFLTSMGIFGFLSRAHIEQGMPTGDIAAKVSLIDEKIKIQRDNIDLSRNALSQMDAQVNARLDRGASEQSAERAVQIRRQQSGEREKIQKEIAAAQKIIASLNEERAPIASELRKVEAEVGPIKYIAAMIYGDSTDNNTLEAAVRWVIIILVLVFDPLAIALVLAGNQSREWDKEKPKRNEDDEPLINNQPEQTSDIPPTQSASTIPEPKIDIETITVDRVDIVLGVTPEEEVYKDLDKKLNPIQVVEEPKKDLETIYALMEDTIEPKPIVKKFIKTEGITQPIVRNGSYIEVEGKQMHEQAAKEIYPEILRLAPDQGKTVSVNFGTNFPKYAQRGDMFTRVDMLPNLVFKFDGSRWLELNKSNTVTYLSQPKYIEYLVGKISNGEYDLESLTESEQLAIEDYLRAIEGK